MRLIAIRAGILVIGVALIVSVVRAGTTRSPVKATEATRGVDVKQTEFEAQPAPTVAAERFAAKRVEVLSASQYRLMQSACPAGAGGALQSESYGLWADAGASLSGDVNSESFSVASGVWGGGGGRVACLVALAGDVNENGSVTSSDIIYLVSYVFKGGPAPLPCTANGDVNCSGSMSSADIIYLVSFVFKGGSPPCDICTDPDAMDCVP